MNDGAPAPAIAGHDRGRIVAKERMTPRRVLRWRITVRERQALEAG
ncbi:MAG: hypothetical protein M3Z15_13625 [Pseudomonadota bacterium]|nr:hypothetical protein [Pseudomonadota bacterium]